jgi:hypothetical protein
MSLNQLVLIGVSVLIPTLVFLLIQTLRRFHGIWRSGGADVIGTFVVLDAAISYDRIAFGRVVRSPALAPYVGDVALISIFVGVLLLALTVAYGEEKLMEAEANAAGNLPVGPFVVIWGSTVSYVAAHLMYFLGEWR